MRRSFALLLPAVTFAAVALLVLGPAAERPLVTARLYGGPTDRLARWTGWVAAEYDGKPFAAGRLELYARARDGNEARVDLVLDADGHGDVEFDFGPNPPHELEVVLQAQGKSLGRARAALPAAAWRARVQRRGGFASSGSGPLTIAIAPERGVLTPPFPGGLWLKVEDARGPRVATLTLKGDGARVTPSTLATDARGLARVELEPFELVPSLRVTAQTAEGVAQEWTSNVPLLPGALLAEFGGAELRLTSPIERREAWLRFVNEDGRLSGRRVELVSDGSGRSRAAVPLPPLPSGPLWAVVSTEPPIGEARVVGWPRSLADAGQTRTFDATDALLIDWGPRARELERLRRRRLHGLAFGLAFAGGALSVWWVWRAQSRRARELDDHLRRELSAGEVALLSPKQGGQTLLMALLIGAGFLLLVALLAWQWAAG